MRKLWHKVKHWLIKKLGVISMEEAAKLLNERDKEIKSLKDKLKSPYPHDFNEKIVIERHMVEPVVLSQTYAIRDFHGDFEEEKVKRTIIDHLTQKIANHIVTHKLYEIKWSNDFDPISLERVVMVKVRVVPPREEWRADNEQREAD